MQPFDTYPGEGRDLLGQPKRKDNARYGYGLELQRLTGQRTCAYCQVSLVDDYYHWLLLSVDHVLPRGEAMRLGVPVKFCEDFVNLVLCCSACNGFGNRYTTSYAPRNQWDLESFIRVRDEVFVARSELIAARGKEELNFFLSRPWDK